MPIIYPMKLNSLLFLLFLGVMSCNTKTRETNNKSLMYIVTTTGMIGDAVHNIVKEKAKVEAMMGPGVDPHLYKATRKDLTMLREASVVFYNGLHLEGKMGDVLEKFSKKKNVIPVGEAISASKLNKMDQGGNTIDPHIWFDVSLWIEVVRHITDKMVEIDPENAVFYQKNSKEYIRKLEKLHQETKSQIASIAPQRRVLITAHDAFGYFGKAYNIEVKGLQGISTMSEFGMKDITDFVNFIVERKVKAVFVETSIPKKSLEAVVRGCTEKKHPIKIGGTLYSDAMGEAGTPEGTYMGMVTHNVKTIVEALK